MARKFELIFPSPSVPTPLLQVCTWEGQHKDPATGEVAPETETAGGVRVLTGAEAEGGEEATDPAQDQIPGVEEAVEVGAEITRPRLAVTTRRSSAGARGPTPPADIESYYLPPTVVSYL